jgi:hypothetical protein
MSVTVFLRPGPPIGAPKLHGHRVPWCCLAQLPRTCAYVKGRPGAVVGSRPAVRSHVRCHRCPSAPRCHVLPSLIIGPTVGHCHLPTLPKPSSLAVIAAPPLSTEAVIHCLLRTGAPRHCLIASPPPLCGSRCREQAVGASRAPPRRRLHRRSVLQAEFRVRVLPRWSCHCCVEVPSPEAPPFRFSVPPVQADAIAPPPRSHRGHAPALLAGRVPTAFWAAWRASSSGFRPRGPMPLGRRRCRNRPLALFF